MPMLAFADLVNAALHILFAVVYFYMVKQSLRAPDLTEDQIDLRRQPMTRAAAAIGGVAALVVGLVMLTLWFYFLVWMDEPVNIEGLSEIIHASAKLIVSVMLIISGIAMLQMWTHAIGLYFISVVALLTTTLFYMLFFAIPTHPFAMDLIGILSATILLLTGGIAFTAQYFRLAGFAGRREIRSS